MSRYRDVIGVYRGGPAAVSARLVRWGWSLRVLPGDADQPRPPEGPNEAGVAEGLRARRACVMTLPGEQVFLRVLTLEQRPGVRFTDAVAEQIAHFDETGEVRTIRALSRSRAWAGHRSVLFALARAEAVEAAFFDAGEQGLDLVDLVPAPLALYNGAAAQLGSRRPLLCVLVGADATEIFLGRGRIPLMARRLSVGQRAFGAEGGEGEAWDDWVSELKAALDFARTLWPGDAAVPRRAVLCGPGRHDAPFLRRLQSALGFPCLDAAELAWARRRGAVPEFTPALGCALSGLGRAAIPLSVFPAPAHERQLLKRQMPWWAAASACAILGVLLPAVRLHQARTQHRRQVQDLQDRIATLSGLEQELTALQASNQTLRRGMAPLRGTLQGAESARRVLQAVAAAKHEADWVILAADADRYLNGDRPGLSRGGGRDRPGVPTEHLVIEGYTPSHDLSTVRAMIEKLRRHPIIADVDLLADDRLREDTGRDRLWAPLDSRLFALEIRTFAP